MTFQNLRYGGGFEVNMADDVDGIVIDQVNRTKYLFWKWKRFGASKTGLVWAGPPCSLWLQERCESAEPTDDE